MRKPSKKAAIRFVGLVMISILFSISAGYALSPQVKYKWTKTIGGSQDDMIYGLATDPAGSVYLTGYFQGTVDFGSAFGTTDVKTASNGAGFITKINSTGTYGWTRTIPVRGYDIAADVSGNAYVVGGFRGTLDFGVDFGVADIKTSTGLSGEDAFITKINSGGTYGWTKTMGGIYGHGACWRIVIDIPGNIYLTGYFVGCVDFGRDFGTSDLQCYHGETDIFITKINADLTYGWTCTEDHGETFDYAYAVAVDLLGNVYVTGKSWGVLGIATPNHIFIKKLNPDGSDAWSKRLIISGPQHGSVNGIAADPWGSVFVAGGFSGTVNFGSPFGTTDIKTASDYDGFVLKIKADGTYGGTRVISGTSATVGVDIATESSGNVYFIGYFMGTVNFAQDFGSSDSKTSAGNYDTFITKIKSDGTYGWTRIMGGNGSDWANAVAPDAFGNAYITGHFSDSVNFGADFGVTDSRTSAGSYDVFLTKLDLLQTDYTTPRHAVGDFDHDAKDEVAFDFGTAGIWLYDQGGWTQLAPENPECLMAGNIGNGLELLADLGSQGLWRWRSGTWSLFSGADLESMAAGLVWIYGSDSHEAFVGDFGGLGVWLWSFQVGWQQLGSADADSIIMAKMETRYLDWIIGDFGTLRMWWRLAKQDWLLLSGANADSMTKGRWLSGTERLIADFGPLGLWEYHKPAGWANLTGADPDFVIAADINADGVDEIAADFGPAGLWLWDNQWTELSSANAEYMIAADVTGDGSDEIAVDFGSAGLWVWNNGPWSQITPMNPEYLLAADTNGDGAKEILADFGAAGLWMWNGAWTQISMDNPD